MKKFLLIAAIIVMATAPVLSKNSDTTLRIKELSEVIVLPIETKTKIIGRQSNRGSMRIKIKGDSAIGKEVGLKFKIKKRAWIKYVSFAIEECDSMLTHMPFKLNIYNYLSKECTNNLVSSIEFVYSKEDMIDDRYTLSFPTPLQIGKGEYILALEFCENFPSKKFLMPTGIMTGHTYFRNSSQSSWQKILLGSTIAAELVEEK